MSFCAASSALIKLQRAQQLIKFLERLKMPASGFQNRFVLKKNRQKF
jgi:hypothetical protein